MDFIIRCCVPRGYLGIFSLVHFYLHRDPMILWVAEMISGIYCLGWVVNWAVGKVGSVLEGSSPVPADSD